MPTEITVTGCGDCPMWVYDIEKERHLCIHPDNVTLTCPLELDSITIKLKQDDPQNTTTAS